MNTHLMIAIAVMMGLIGIAASRDLLRMRRAQLQPVALRNADRGPAERVRGLR
ncbi:MAG TPA: hypothetical protein VJS30_27995 [Paraburkholderia sp.]|nr:hypothetical protein [Paraburkholderia sp.]